jgi:two-component system, chemotaxis family, protein-glutamate methylesterase/glutaminase
VSAGRTSVLVVDDSASNRRTLLELLEAEGDLEVVARAEDGEDGLRKATGLRPDVITLDLEMPRLDGFAFLRLLMAREARPVVVISSYAHRADVFRALELGAVDFIAKPRRGVPEALADFGRELRDKVRGARLARPPKAHPPRPVQPASSLVLVGLGASTGGPSAIQRLLEATAAEPSLCFLVSQHMPAHFTRAFAERLDRLGAFRVSEAHEGDVPQAGRAFIAPGGRQLELVRQRAGLVLHTPPTVSGDRHAPSVDRLFGSMARALGPAALGVVLTGMGADGAEGARALAAGGGEVWAEAEESAVVFGMPQAAIATGAVRRVLPLAQLGPALRVHARRQR